MLPVSAWRSAYAQDVPPNPVRSAQRFLAGRQIESTPTATDAAAQNASTSTVEKLLKAQAEHVRMLQIARARSAADTSLSPAWQPMGPMQVQTALYGSVTGRVTSIAVDPADTTGNTVYIGTTGGGVWKSTNAAAATGTVQFVPLMDTLPVFSANAASSVLPSLSIGAVSVQPGGAGIVLAGTGDPNDATDSYYGEGILRSIDGGTTWTLIQQSEEGVTRHSFLGHAFAGFAWSTQSPNLVVAALSHAQEGVLTNANDSSTNSLGLYVSTDAGVTWQMATLMDGSQIVQSATTNYAATSPGNAATSVIWNPIRQRFYAAVRFHGYYESTNGQTWTRLATQPGINLTTATCPANPGLPGSQSCPIYRGALAVQTTTGDLFAFTVDLNRMDQGIWQDMCNRTDNTCATQVQWAKQWNTTALETDGAIVQGDYNLALAAVPSGNDTLLFAGTQEIQRCSLAAGCLFRNTTNATTGCAAAHVAPSQHAIAWSTLRNGSTAMYFGNDGGLWRSLDLVTQSGSSCGAEDATHFQNLNGALGSLSAVPSFASDPTQPDVVLAGLGALGSAATSTASALQAWTQLGTGESGGVAIQASHPDLWYVQSGEGVAVLGCSKGVACTAIDFQGVPQIGLTQVSGDASLMSAPFLLDPALPTNLITATCRVWRGPATGGAQWSSSNAISSMLAGPIGTACNSSNSWIRSLAAGGALTTGSTPQTSGSPVIYAGMAGTLDGGGAYGGHLYVTRNAQNATSGATWTDATAAQVTNDSSNFYRFNPGNFDISSIAVDPHDATGQTVYATVMGFDVPHLYRSVDGGTTWLNVTRNLPNAPANAVLVDPNDANTVYIATDVGVYATQQITQCPTADCWSAYGSGLPNAPAVTLEAQAALATNHTTQGTLRVGTYGRGIWQIPLLTAGSILQPVLSLSELSLTFPTQTVHTTSTAQSVTLTNTGTAEFTLSHVTLTGEFQLAANDCGTTLAPTASCVLQLTFTPTGGGTRSGTLVLSGNIATGSVTVLLVGTGTGGITLQPASMSFADTALQVASTPQNIVLQNSGTLPIGVSNFATTGDFSITANTCSISIAANTSCTVALVFTPTASGARSGVFSATTDAGTITANLSGRGLGGATDTLSATSFTFANTLVGTTSAAQNLTITNSGDVTLTSLAAKMLSGDFNVVNSCGTSLIGHASCSMQIAFVPSRVGSQQGILQISDALGQYAIPLNGYGLAPAGISLTPTTLTFGNTGVGIASAPQTVTLTNNGGSPLALSSVTLSGEIGLTVASNACAATTVLAPSGACVLQVAFVPQQAGLRTGQLVINSDAGTKAIAFTGTGVDFLLTSDGATSATLNSGQNAVFPLLLTPTVTLPQAVTFACTGAPLHATCKIAPTTADLGSTTVLTVTVLTGVSSTANRSLLLVLALLVLIPCVPRRRKAWLAATLSLALLGCGAGRKIPADGSISGGSSGGGGSGGSTGSTPNGTYPITVVATAAGLTRSVTVQLTVQAAN